MRRAVYILVAMTACLAAACARQVHVPEASENRTVEFEIGAPNFDVEAAPTVNSGTVGLDVFLSIPRASLAFVRDSAGFRASYDVLLTVLEGPATAFQEVWTDTVSTEAYDETQAFDPVLDARHVVLPAGTYTVEVALEDAESGRRAVRRQDVTIVDPTSSETGVGELLLEIARSGSPFRPVVATHVPGAYDSLRSVTELYNVPDEALVTHTVVRFAADTATAAPPFWFTPAPFTLSHVGVDYEDADTVQVARRSIAGASDRFTMEFAVPALETGTYAAILEVAARGERLAERRRYWTVKNPSFPRITSLLEMVHALQYIAREDEMDHLLAARTAEEMKRRFDAFWAERVANREAAASLLEAYYSRVEEANLLFSNHKAGWKTDRGMIYVVFGPPADVEEYGVRKEWYYYERGAILNRRLPPFVFRRSMTYGFSGLFENYVLQRSETYEDDWRRKIEDWRDGTVL